MISPKKLIIIALLIHIVTIIACTSLQKKGEAVNEQQQTEQQLEAVDAEKEEVPVE